MCACVAVVESILPVLIPILAKARASRLLAGIWDEKTQNPKLPRALRTPDLLWMDDLRQEGNKRVPCVASGLGLTMGRWAFIDS